MKESYIEGLAPHDGPESCVGTREDAGEALTGGSAGRVLSCEINLSRTPTLLTEAEGHMFSGDKASPWTVLRGRRPLACTDTPCARTGRSSARPPELGGTHREGQGRTPMTNGQRKSDRFVVPTKPPNKAGWYGCGGGGGKEPGQGEGGRAKHAPDTEPDSRAQCAPLVHAMRQCALASSSEARAQCVSSARWELCGGAVCVDEAKSRPDRDPPFFTGWQSNSVQALFIALERSTHLVPWCLAPETRVHIRRHLRLLDAGARRKARRPGGYFPDFV